MVGWLRRIVIGNRRICDFQVNERQSPEPTGALEIQEFKELKNPFVPKRVELEEQITALELSKANRLEPLRKWVLKANQAGKAVSSDNWLEMKSFLQSVGSNRLLRAQTLTVSFKNPFDLLAETTLAIRNTLDGQYGVGLVWVTLVWCGLVLFSVAVDCRCVLMLHGNNL
jgi:hypothetical protein